MSVWVGQVWRLVVPLLFFGASEAQTLHKISVVDHAFKPRVLNIIEGDTVRWEWNGDLHNVVAVVTSKGKDKSGAFESEILNTNSTFEVIFSRDLLNEYSRDGGIFNYICEPHVPGMFGSVSVTRISKKFNGIASAWQAGGVGEEEIKVRGELSANERTLSLRLPEITTPLSVELRLGGLGQKGVPICSGVISVGGSLDCAIDDSDTLFQAGMFVNIASNIRAQLVQDGPSGSISGGVKDSNGLAMGEVTVAGGSKTAISDSFGRYRISEIPYGVYRIQANTQKLAFKESGWKNPVLVTTSEQYQRDFEAIAQELTLFTPTPTPSPTSSITENELCSNIQDNLAANLNSMFNSFDASIIYTNSIQILSFLKTGKIAIKAVDLTGTIFVDEEFDGSVLATLPQGKNTFEVQIETEGGARICTVPYTITIDSPLTPKNLNKVYRLLLKTKNSFSTKALESKRLQSVAKLLDSMLSGGSKNPDFPNILTREALNGFKFQLEAILNIRNSPKKKLTKLIRSISRSLNKLSK
jgi:plastocyanin